METDWKLLTLRDAGVTLIDCDHRTPPASETGYPYVTIPQLRNGRIVLDAVRRITEEQFAEWTRKALPAENDVVLSRRCNPGETAFVPPELKFALGQNLVLLRASGEHVYPPFLRWLVRGPEWWGQIGKFLNVGAVFDSLRCADVPKFRLKIPPLNEQRAIARILGALDDKIELNRRMSETLESIARALFKSWFVDFDPVRAKAEGRDPGLPKSLADLFPGRLVDSEFGEIPEGWSAKPLGRWVDALSGGTPSKSTRAYWDGAVPWISPKVMTGIHADKADEHVSELAIKSGTRIAPALSTLVMVRGMGLHEFVRVSQARRDVAFNQDVKALVGTSIDATLLLFALLDAQPTLLERVESSGHGTGKLPSDVLFALPIAMPDPTTQLRLASSLRVLNDRIASSRAESRTLNELRDTLLPKLTTGELRVPGSAASTALA